MIAKLNGRIDETGVDSLVIDVNGVGYLVQASARTLAALGGAGDFATVFTEMLVSENDQRLIGFASREERDWFRLLIGVQGVGAKVALAILSALEADDLTIAIANGDSAMVARANGVGPKLA
ncbi:MAG: Holliday junction branch migration protein RuvA, partial [Sphingomonadales bacterium]